MTSLVLFVSTVWNCGLVAVNTVMYVEYGDPLSLGAAILCGLMGIVSSALWVSEVRS